MSTTATYISEKDIEVKNSLLRDISANYDELVLSTTGLLLNEWLQEGTNRSKKIDEFHYAFADVISELRIKAHKPEALVSHAKWIGVIDEVDNDDEVFSARLKQLGETSQPEEIAEFEFEQVPEHDRNLIKTGAEFYFNVGYLTTSNGTRTRAGVISFRRLLKVTSEEVEIAEKAANKLVEEIQFD